MKSLNFSPKILGILLIITEMMQSYQHKTAQAFCVNSKIYKTRLRQSCPLFPHNCNRWLTWFISVILEYKLQILWENAKLKNVDMKDIRYIIYVNNHFVVILVEKLGAPSNSIGWDLRQVISFFQKSMLFHIL